MTDTLTAPVTVDATTEPDNRLNHWTCCVNADVALCGTDVTEDVWEDFDEASCVVCDDLVDDAHCPLTRRRCPT